MFNLSKRLFTNLNGDRLVNGIKSEWEAVAIMEQLGIHFTWLNRECIKGRRSHWSNEVELVPGIHHYFMLGQGDVGYYTPIMESLFIHDRPRPWSNPPLS